MIKFIEKEKCIYMVENGEEHFVLKRQGRKDAFWIFLWEEECKRTLFVNEGKYFRLHGFHEDPIEMLREIAAKRAHFTDESDLFSEFPDYLDFHGNFTEGTADFLYLIYDAELIQKIKKYVSAILEEKYELVV